MKDLNIYQNMINRLHITCKQFDSQIQIDWNKVERIIQQWLERNEKISLDDINIFCSNIESILEKEIEIRLYEKSVKDAIGLTK